MAPPPWLRPFSAGRLPRERTSPKPGSRAVINTSPEPFSNWAASFTEDAAVLGGLWLALVKPAAFLIVLLLLLGLALVLFFLLRKRFRSSRGGPS